MNLVINIPHRPIGLVCDAPATWAISALKRPLEISLRRGLSIYSIEGVLKTSGVKCDAAAKGGNLWRFSWERPGRCALMMRCAKGGVDPRVMSFMGIPLMCWSKELRETAFQTQDFIRYDSPNAAFPLRFLIIKFRDIPLKLTLHRCLQLKLGHA